MQPTVAEEIALHLLFFILLHDAAQRNEPYLPIEQVRSNMEQASRLGLDAHLHHIDRDGQLQTVSARVLAAELIDTAVQLWHTHQAHEAAELVATLRQRLDPAVGTPSVAVLHLYQRVTSYDTNPCEATRQILHAYVVT
ncbi:MAG: hypothetical protein HC837_19765 [Chloroflexaceae bacterium]|nr:hypothetical protein [Chloroflexaceae bacterium]